MTDHRACGLAGPESVLAGERARYAPPRPAWGESLRRYAELTGLPFALADVPTQMLLYSPIAELCPIVPDAVIRELESARGPQVVVDAPGGLIFYGAPLPGEPPSQRMAVGFVPVDPLQPPAALMQAALSAGWTPRQWQEWAGRLERLSPDVVRRLLHLAEAQIRSDAERRRFDLDLDDLASQLDAVYEELSLLHDVARNLRVSLDPVELARLCLDRLQRSIGAMGCAILLQDGPAEPQMCRSGDLPVPDDALPRVIARLEGQPGGRPIVRNRLDGMLRDEEFAGLRNLIAAAVLDGERPIGWILAFNTEGRPEFGTVEASLLQSIALILGTHFRNFHLFQEQEDLLISFVRSLVSTLDAKDSYTRGHSERVALVARRLAKQLRLAPTEQEAIHLSAVLHDIGKIGVEDAILRKPGRLTEAEFRKLQQHPVIGYDILSELKQLQHILPGVRHHHENFDGTGYPDQLGGADIPLMARIMAVADAYDAMGSDRPYRSGMPLEQVEAILDGGAGQQWDPEVVRAYFAVKEDIRRIWLAAQEPEGK